MLTISISPNLSRTSCTLNPLPPLGGLGDDDSDEDDNNDQPPFLTILPLILLPEADLIVDDLLDLELLGDILGSTTPPDDLPLEEEPPITSDPLDVLERFLCLDDSFPEEDLSDDSILREALLDEPLEVLEVLELLPDDLLPEEVLTDEPLEARSLKDEPLTAGTGASLTADPLSRGDLDLTLLLDREAVLLESLSSLTRAILDDVTMTLKYNFHQIPTRETLILHLCEL